MNIRFDARAFVAALLLWMGASVGAQAQLLNGDFQSSPKGTGWTYSAGGTSWVVANPNGTSGNTGGAGPANQVAAISGSRNITQTFSVSAGTYQISFQLLGDGNGASHQISWSVTIGSTVISSASGVNYSSSAWSTLNTIEFSAGSNTKITFANSGTHTFDVDNITLTETPGRLPGSGLLSYVALALVGLVFGGRKLLAQAPSRVAGA